jgi:hypothetical protein
MNFQEKRLLLKPDFCFYHIPKCGGSTVQKTLNDLFSSFYKKTEIHCPECLDYFERKYNLYTESEIREFVDHKTIKQLSHIKILLCHVKYDSPNISDKFGEHKSSIILRDPTSRVISHYEFFDYPETKVHMIELPNHQLEEYCKRMSTLMTSFLSRNGDVSEALDNIHKIDFVGDVSNINDFTKQITKFYCEKFDMLSYEEDVIIRNTNENKIVDKKLIKKVSEIISDSLDQKLYNQLKVENII